MGIKGVFGELGAGERVSLAKLSVKKLEDSGRPLRLAIDISIWQFQAQAARGGTNPAIRTLFYRLVRLLGLGIQPIFVFDGPHKPVFKRNKRSGRSNGVADATAKRLIRLFGFRIHDAPGEAEAECALLQRHGVVDAVLSEDVDTLMFGCTRALRNWSSQTARGSQPPTHVSLYDIHNIQTGRSGLDREGMVLVALISGGDYLPEGIPGCGIKVACEAARAGFGKSLCRIKRADANGIQAWKTSFSHELRTNESGFFRTRHRALAIPDDFPDFDILRYYTHPVVSRVSEISGMTEDEKSWNMQVDVDGLREFTKDTFDWTGRIGVVKLTRILAPSLLVRRLLARSIQPAGVNSSLEAIAEAESLLVSRISGRRKHMSTDGEAELRISYVPTNIVGVNLDDEPEEAISCGRDGLALNSDDDVETPIGGDNVVNGVGSGAKTTFDPTAPTPAWVLETIAKLGVPLAVEDWEATQRAKDLPRQKGKSTKNGSKVHINGTQPPPAATLDAWVKTIKPRSAEAAKLGDGIDRLTLPDRSEPPKQLPPLARAKQSGQPGPSLVRSKPLKKRRDAPATWAGEPANPWTPSGSQIVPRIAKPRTSAEAIFISSSPSCTPSPCHRARVNERPIQIASSPPATSPGITPVKPRSRRQTSERETNNAQTTMKNYPSGPDKSNGAMISPLGSPVGRCDVLARRGTSSPKSAGGTKQTKVRDWLQESLPMRAGKQKERDAPKRTTKILMPRASNVGYFKEVEVTIEEADQMAGIGSAARRKSGLSVIDLTGED